jgi:hypothetical protein
MGHSIVLDSRIEKAAAKEGRSRYGMSDIEATPAQEGAYLWTTDGHIAAIRHVSADITGPETIPAELLRKCKSAKSVDLEITDDGGWSADADKHTCGPAERGNRCPKVEGVLPAAKSITDKTHVIISISADLLLRLANAIGPRNTKALQQSGAPLPYDPAGVRIAVDKRDTGASIVVLADDGQGIGLLMPRRLGYHGDAGLKGLERFRSQYGEHVEQFQKARHK